MSRVLLAAAVLSITAGVVDPPEAHAQPAAVEAPSSSSGFDLSGLGEELVIAVVGTVLAIMFRRSQLDATRRQMVLTFGDMAYGVVNEIARRTTNRIDDKVALGLRKVLDLLQANGQPPLSAAEELTIRTLFDAKHGNEAKAAERAQLAAPKVVTVNNAPALANTVAANPQTPPAL